MHVNREQSGFDFDAGGGRAAQCAEHRPDPAPKERANRGAEVEAEAARAELLHASAGQEVARAEVAQLREDEAERRGKGLWQRLSTAWLGRERRRGGGTCKRERREDKANAMMRYYITHTDQHGEKHQLPGAWEGSRPDDAIARMLRESHSLDDGMWEAHAVTEEQP